ncbi:Tex-like N-terminal domain-containing protein [Mesomycoplasma neurolyticum]|uniref:RNA (S1 domain)-binding protein n=1 Tax=Mesomycoplasma neurolyticum TaxID=2120 RepID=A0A449A4E7_9BACT|nr:Tex-like N-terminal domain-containing protein [Mesomycoplasma neurolyticum]VEU59131.1 RNA (S1 domain)-binding protein [Mesomycoplasma neurolyticum]
MFEKEIVGYLAQKINTKEIYIERTLELLEQENTIAFIARYRKDYTNNLDEKEIKIIDDEYQYQKKLLKRKEFIINTLKEKELLSDELLSLIKNTKKLIELEAIYKPYSTNRKTKASIAIALGLDPLAKDILQFKKDLPLIEKAKQYLNETLDTVEKVINGAKDIIAEIVSQDGELRNFAFNNISKRAKILTNKKNNDLDSEKKYELYYKFAKPIIYLQEYQLMAIDRAYNKDVISVKLDYDKNFLINKAISKYTKNYIWEGKLIIEEAIKDSYKRLIFPSVETQVYNELLEKAHIKSTNIFAKNLQQLLLQKPLKNKVILGWDPGFNSGCKLAVVNYNNELLSIKVIFPLKPHNKIQDSETIILDLINKFKIEIIAIGNGTGSWESIEFIENLITKNNLKIHFLRTSEVGASIYSASENAQLEFPELSVEKRSAISIARRVVDPMAELIKINPQNIGIGQYQHDIKKSILEKELNYTLSFCTNKVGVNLNSASVELLSNISGFNQRIAKQVVKYIQTKGMILNRNDLLKIPYLTEKVFQQAAGFLRISESANIFDQTKIHPEMYSKAEEILKYLKLDKNSIGKVQFLVNDEIINEVHNELNIDFYTTKLILESFNEPFRDFREQFSEPLLRNKSLKIENLEIDNQLKAIITNITDFGVFADIGLKNDAFIHISEIKNLENNALYISQVIDVKIAKIDLEKQKINLSLVL